MGECLCIKVSKQKIIVHYEKFTQKLKQKKCSTRRKNKRKKEYKISVQKVWRKARKEKKLDKL